MSRPHRVCPRSRPVCLPVYTAQAPGCSAGELSKAGPGLWAGSGSRVLPKGTDLVGPAFRALPRCERLRQQVLGKRAYSPSWVVRLITSLVPAPWFPGCAGRALPQVCYVSLLGSWSLTATLLVDVNRPGSQEDFVSNWEPAHSLVQDAVSGADMAPCLLALACRLPASGRGRDQSAATELSSDIPSILCSVSGPGCASKLFPGKFSIFFPLWLFRQFGLLSHISTLKLSSGHSVPVLTLCMQPIPPCSAPAYCWWMRVSRPPLCWESWLGA